MTRLERLRQQGFTKCVDSGYSSSKEGYKDVVDRCNSLGRKVLRVKSDSKGLINYMVFAKEE